MKDIYIYGDSHALLLFEGCQLPHRNLFQYAITMHRIGRDKQLYNFKPEHNDSQRVFCIVYGEVDVRCHIGAQIEKGRTLEDICYELVSAYFYTIRTQITSYEKIIVFAVPPPVAKEDHAHPHPIPFVGTDEDRVRYTDHMNQLLEEFSVKGGIVYFNPYAPYKRENGCLKYELSDNCLHIGKNEDVMCELERILG